MRAGWFIPPWPIPLEVPPMSTALLTDLVIFVLSLWVGFEVISKVPATLHTPLMSAANSIHGIVLVGAMLIAVTAHDTVGYIIAFLAAAFAAANGGGVSGGPGRNAKNFPRAPGAPGARRRRSAGSRPGRPGREWCRHQR